MGATLALRDARTLAQELSTARPGRLDRALDRYVDHRRPVADRVRRTARLEARLALATSPAVSRPRDWLVAKTPLADWFLRQRA
jgi:2-polyprenyl-6-methoxyphenol hydroxylase-like FAD-dependent oxidoreductase